jgi:hypothetical protein
MRYLIDGIEKNLILRKPPTGPRAAPPEDRLRGCLEGRRVLLLAAIETFTGSKEEVR